jgi:hypothetical protein
LIKPVANRTGAPPETSATRFQLARRLALLRGQFAGTGTLYQPLNRVADRLDSPRHHVDVPHAQ